MSLDRPRRSTGNRQKHESRNPAQRAMIGRFHDEVVRLVTTTRATSVLEIGCGEGFVLEALLAGGVDAELRGVDLDARAIRDARSRLPAQVELDVADARDLALDRPPDLVMMLEVLEHLDDPAQMLDDLHSLTTGAVLLSVPHEPFFRGLNLLRLKNVRRWGSDPEHLHHWGRADFVALVGEHFRVDEVGRAFPWTLVLASPTSPG